MLFRRQYTNQPVEFGKKNLMFAGSLGAPRADVLVCLRSVFEATTHRIETEVVAYERSDMSGYASPSDYSFESLTGHSGGGSRKQIFRGPCGRFWGALA